ncbi:MAG: DUF2892 domain-containing protein [Spirochaetes bacterium]|nr:DUF2892 domain-containing protein [Spirochaetota bacterium]
MKRNMGTADRILRTLLAVVVGVFYFTGQITGIAAIILGLLAVVFIVTAAIGFCPLYLPLHLRTCRDGRC